MKNFLVPIIICSLLFGCGKPATEAAKDEHGREEAGHVEGKAGQKVVEEGHAEAMRQAFLACPSTALADLEASAPEWPWTFMLENLDRRLCEALERSVNLGMTLAVVWCSAEEFEREERIEVEALEAVRRVAVLRELLAKQRDKTNALLRALPEVAA